MNFAFWNAGRNESPTVVSDLVHERKIEFLALAEIGFSPETLCQDYVSRFGSALYRLGPASNRIDLYTTRDPANFRPLLDTRHASFREFIPAIGGPILLGACHLRSKASSSDADQSERATELYRRITEQEEQLGHSRTVLFGDFNMNPFEQALISARAFHAVMDRRQASKNARVVDEIQRRYFYNPMWHLMGNRDNDARGTYFHDSSDAHNYFWNTFDQVLVRPDLLDQFDDESLEIVESVVGTSLLKDGDAKIGSKYSDHLPLFFKIHNL